MIVTLTQQAITRPVQGYEELAVVSSSRSYSTVCFFLTPYLSTFVSSHLYRYIFSISFFFVVLCLRLSYSPSSLVTIHSPFFSLRLILLLIFLFLLPFLSFFPSYVIFLLHVFSQSFLLYPSSFFRSSLSLELLFYYIIIDTIITIIHIIIIYVLTFLLIYFLYLLRHPFNSQS